MVNNPLIIRTRIYKTAVGFKHNTEIDKNRSKKKKKEI